MSPWTEDGQTWRRLKVCFPDGLATHNREQTFYFDQDRLLQRHDFVPEITAGEASPPSVRFASDYREVAGIRVATTHRIHGISPDGTADHGITFVTIDLDDLKFK